MAQQEVIPSWLIKWTRMQYKDPVLQSCFVAELRSEATEAVLRLDHDCDISAVTDLREREYDTPALYLHRCTTQSLIPSAQGYARRLAAHPLSAVPAMIKTSTLMTRVLMESPTSIEDSPEGKVAVYLIQRAPPKIEDEMVDYPDDFGADWTMAPVHVPSLTGIVQNSGQATREEESEGEEGDSHDSEYSDGEGQNTVVLTMRPVVPPPSQGTYVRAEVEMIARSYSTFRGSESGPQEEDAHYVESSPPGTPIVFTPLNLTAPLPFVSSSLEKYKEMSSLAANFRLCEVSALYHRSLDIVEIQGTSQEVILAKARAAYVQLRTPLVVEDFSYDSKEYPGIPGPYVKSILGACNPAKLYEMLRHLGARTMYMTARYAYIDDFGVIVFTSRMIGRLVPPGGGTPSSVDFITCPHGANQSYGVMGYEERLKFNPRLFALYRLDQFLSRRWKTNIGRIKINGYPSNQVF